MARSSAGVRPADVSPRHAGTVRMHADASSRWMIVTRRLESREANWQNPWPCTVCLDPPIGEGRGDLGGMKFRSIAVWLKKNE